MKELNTPAMLEEFFRPKLPHIWCPGCAHGIVTKALVKAVEQVGLDRTKTVFVSGIGCSSRATGYLDFGTIHTTHGRALAYATGIKLARPELKVIVISGDGDASSIGGNHLIHAARRNIDLTLLVYQNGTYGMTGGQSAPTTRKGQISTTAPNGQFERAFDLCNLVKAAGASYVARGTAYHFEQLTSLLAKAIQKKGFSFVEALSSCPTFAGRMNGMEQGVRNLMWMRDHTLPPDADFDGENFPVGVIHDVEAPEWNEVYRSKA